VPSEHRHHHDDQMDDDPYRRPKASALGMPALNEASLLSIQRSAHTLQLVWRWRCRRRGAAAKAERYGGYVELLRSAGRIASKVPARKWATGSGGGRHTGRGLDEGTEETAVVRMLDHVERQLASLGPSSQVSVGTLLPLLSVVRESQQRLLAKLASSKAAQDQQRRSIEATRTELRQLRISHAEQLRVQSDTLLAEAQQAGSMKAAAAAEARQQIALALRATEEERESLQHELQRVRAEQLTLREATSRAEERAETLSLQLEHKEGVLQTNKASHAREMRLLRSQLQEAQMAAATLPSSPPRATGLLAASKPTHIRGRRTKRSKDAAAAAEARHHNEHALRSTEEEPQNHQQ